MDVIGLEDFTIGPLFLSVVLVFITIALLLWHSSRKQSYWKKQGVPFVKPLPIFGSVLGKLFKSLHYIEMDRFKKFGRIYGHYEGNRAFLSVAEPEIVHSILVKDFQAFTERTKFESGDKMLDRMLPGLLGEEWKRVRSIIAATFTTGKIKRMMSIFNECSKTLVKNIRETSKKGEPIDGKRIYSDFAMDTIASAAFSYKVDSHIDPNNEFVTTAKQIFSRKITWRILVYLLLTPFMKLFKICVLPPKAIKFFNDRVLQISEKRKRTGQTRNDYLQLLIDTMKEIDEERKLDLNGTDDITKNYRRVDLDQTFQSNFKKNLTQEELVAQCVIFFFAGYVTTASALSFISYELALNPDIQERLIQEVDEAFRANGGELSYESLQSMKYLDNVISETLRLYPPFVRLIRIADEDYKLGDTGLNIPKGLCITIPIYTLHRDPKFFSNPEKFDPDRFSPEERAKQIPYSYLPFGAGPRHCVAMRFALMEVKVCLAHVLHNFWIKKCSKTKVPVEYQHDIGFLQPKNVPLSMDIRKDLEKELET